MPSNPELRYWQAVLRAAEAELDAATSNADLKIAARRFMRARRQVAMLEQAHPHHSAQPPARRRRRPP
jgi:hypothetical protein